MRKAGFSDVRDAAVPAAVLSDRLVELHAGAQGAAASTSATADARAKPFDTQVLQRRHPPRRAGAAAVRRRCAALRVALHQLPAGRGPAATVGSATQALLLALSAIVLSWRLPRHALGPAAGNAVLRRGQPDVPLALRVDQQVLHPSLSQVRPAAGRRWSGSWRHGRALRPRARGFFVTHRRRWWFVALVLRRWCRS